MRNLVAVLRQIQSIIPESETRLIVSLASIENSAPYTAPEMQGRLWHEATNTINHYLNYPPQEDWEWKVASIWMDSPVEDLQLVLK